MGRTKQNWKKRLGTVLLTIFLVSILFVNHSFADVGSFESYSSGGSSWSSSDSSSSSESGGRGSIIEVVIVVVCIILRIYVKSVGGKKGEVEALAKLQAIDPDFNKEEFITWSKMLFAKLQQEWTACDWENIRTFENTELFEKHKAQLQGYINNYTINVMDHIYVNHARLYHFKQEGGQDVLTVEINSRMIDYIKDANTGKVLRGDKRTKRMNTYLLTFVRTTGVTTTKATGEVSTTNCPNCGAPIKITSSGKCEYCRSVITTDTHEWVLSNLQRK